MVTIDTIYTIQWYTALSGDIWPDPADTPNGARLYVMDTGDLYINDRENENWIRASAWPRW